MNLTLEQKPHMGTRVHRTHNADRSEVSCEDVHSVDSQDDLITTPTSNKRQNELSVVFSVHTVYNTDDLEAQHVSQYGVPLVLTDILECLAEAMLSCAAYTDEA